MTYCLRASIASESVLRGQVRKLPHASVVSIGYDLAIIPVTNDVIKAASAGSSMMAGFLYLSEELGRIFSSWSTSGQIAYVEAEYFGGVGEQHVQMWDSGVVVLGPLHLGEDESIAPLGSPISQVLRRLGIDKATHFDEFDAVGLGRHQDTQDWLIMG